MVSMKSKRIGEIFCDEGYISRFQLKEALEKQKSGKKRPLGQILMDLGYITAEQLCDSLLIQTK